MENMKIYESVRSVPATAKKEITAGRLRGKSDINPMWRIKTLTEQFGSCGFGWKYEILSERLEKGENGEIAAFVMINLYVKFEGEWSEAIPGTGGSSFIANENKGPYMNDECFKMALTDALSVSCKAIGVGADVYWEKDTSKYDKKLESTNTQSQATQKPQQETGEIKPSLEPDKLEALWSMAKSAGQDKDSIHAWIEKKFNKTSTKDLTVQEFKTLCTALARLIDAKSQEKQPESKQAS